MKQSLKMTLKCVYVIFISLACSNMGLVPPRFGIKYAIYKTKNIGKEPFLNMMLLKPISFVDNTSKFIAIGNFSSSRQSRRITR